MSERITQLEAQLARASSPREEIDALNELAWEIRNDDHERSMALAQQAYELSISGEFSAERYAMGQAASLTTRAYLDRNGSLDKALDKCFQALTLIESAPPNPVIVRCMRLICWLYFYLGEYSNALHYGLSALNIAKAGGFNDLTAATLNSLTMVYAVTGDYEQALKMQAEALEVSQKIHDDIQEMGALNQGANVWMRLGDLKRALELATQAWKLAQQMEQVEAQTDAADTLGEVLQALGEYARAEQLFAETLALDAKLGNEWGQANSWLGLGKLHFSQKELEQAEADLQKSLALATKTGSRQLQMDCYVNLYQIAEQQGNWDQAFLYLKRYHELYEENHNETASKKLALLKVAHQLETAKRDAEIYHLRNEELLREIEERKRMEQALQELAMTDSLTGLFNRRHFFNMAESILSEAIRYKHPLSIMVMDIDHFKQVNDSYGHATGDEAIKFLAANIRRAIRAVDVAARFGGDEFVLMLPETNVHQASLTAERLRGYIAKTPISAGEQQMQFTLSIGIASTSDQENVTRIDTLLEQADKALYKAKQNGRNQMQVWGQ